jgi:hypothetical protein
MPEYPRTFKHVTKGGKVVDGKVCAGRYKRIKSTQVEDRFGGGGMVDKALVNLELANGEEVTYWLDGVVLGLFKRELELRAKVGKNDFDPDELITITQSDEMRQSKTSDNQMWDYSVDFEHAAPPLPAADVLRGIGPVEIGNGRPAPSDDIPDWNAPEKENLQTDDVPY